VCVSGGGVQYWFRPSIGLGLVSWRESPGHGQRGQGGQGGQAAQLLAYCRRIDAQTQTHSKTRTRTERAEGGGKGGERERA
jgi:hypothetical protein